MLRLLTPRAAGYAAEIAHAFDALDASGWSIREAAARMGVTTAQLSNWLAADPAVLGEVNRRRAGRGLRPLRPRV